MQIFTQYKGLPRPVYALFGAQVINRFGDFVAPFLSFYVTTRLGYGAHTAGLIMTLNALIGVPGMLFGGKIADHIPKKQAYILFQALSAITTLLCLGPFPSEAIVGLLLVKSFFAAMTRPAIMGLLIDCLPPEKRSVGFSLNYLGINVGVAFGPLVAGFLFNRSLPLIFIGDALTSILGVWIIWRYVSANVHKEHGYELPEAEKHDDDHWIQALLKRPQVLGFLGIMVLFNIVYVQTVFALPLYLADLFNDQGPMIFGVLMSINAITVLIATPFLMHWTRNRPPTEAIMICGLLYAIGYGFTGYMHAVGPILAATVIWTLGEVLISTHSGVYLAALSPANYRARFSSLSGITYAGGSAIGTWVAGWYLQTHGHVSLWLGVGLISLVASGLTYWFSRFHENECAPEVQNPNRQ